MLANQTVAQEAQGASPSEMKELAQLEQTIFSRRYEKDPLDKRLHRLEFIVFAESKPGSVAERLNRVHAAISGNRTAEKSRDISKTTSPLPTYPQQNGLNLNQLLPNTQTVRHNPFVSQWNSNSPTSHQRPLLNGNYTTNLEAMKEWGTKEIGNMPDSFVKLSTKFENESGAPYSGAFKYKIILKSPSRTIKYMGLKFQMLDSDGFPVTNFLASDFYALPNSNLHQAVGRVPCTRNEYLKIQDFIVK